MKGKEMHWQELEVWKKSHNLTMKIYQLTREFPQEERYGLTSQIRRAAYSIPLNIVEGHTRKTSKEFLQFLNVARGSLEELRYLLILCRDINYLSKAAAEPLEDLAAEICRMTNALIKSIKRKI